MSPSAFELALKAIEDWKSNPPTEEDRIKFLKDTIAGLEDPKQASELSKNLEGLAVIAVKTDESFANVANYFKNFVDKHGHDFPGLSDYLKEWDGFQIVSPRSLVLQPLNDGIRL
jgi:hypothetical protein